MIQYFRVDKDLSDQRKFDKINCDYAQTMNLLHQSINILMHVQQGGGKIRGRGRGSGKEAFFLINF